MSRSREIDRAIGDIGSRQHGVVSRRQLVEIGVGRHAIEHRLDFGRLRTVRHGVYVLGASPLTWKARRLADVLACGPGAVLSYRDAGVHWGVLRSERSLTDVTAQRGRRAPRGVQLHYDSLEPDEVTVVDAIPITSISRTVLDLAGVLSNHRLARAMTQVDVLRLYDTVSLTQLLARRPRRRGSPNLRALLAAATTTVTRSELEDLFAEFIEGDSLATPLFNHWIQVRGIWIECDCVWPHQRLIVELDSHGVHGTRASFEQDRKRDRALQAEGWRVIRVTWRHLHDEPGALAADLRRLLA